MNINKLAVLVNLLGGIEETSKELEIDDDIINKAISGKTLTRRESAELENAYNNKINIDEIVDPQEVDDYAKFLDELLDTPGRRLFTYRPESKIVFRQAVANDQMTLEELDKGYGLWLDLTGGNQGERILQWFGEDSKHFAQDFIDAYLADGNIWDIENSEFWEWFRETFYNE